MSPSLVLGKRQNAEKTNGFDLLANSLLPVHDRSDFTLCNKAVFPTKKQRDYHNPLDTTASKQGKLTRYECACDVIRCLRHFGALQQYTPVTLAGVTREIKVKNETASFKNPHEIYQTTGHQ